ncbi:transporter substrate-binding domain-containing protein [Embleya sp. AB8]|uniref:transporter substrate-binding domain-containing protein n=1 Tax=Embleya sp. AB8 TaxID=3156304 RepID=UPI003C7527AE
MFEHAVRPNHPAGPPLRATTDRIARRLVRPLAHRFAHRRAASAPAAVVLTAFAVLASCTSTHQPKPGPTAAPSAPTPTAAAAGPCGNPIASLRPLPGPPRAADYPTDGSLARILQRGYLTVGIDQSTYPFGYADVADHNRLKGFDVDLAREIAADLFGSGDAGRLRFRVLTNNIREREVADGKVDLVAKSVTVNCGRRALVDFSSVYYEAGQRVLVVRDSPAAAADHTKGLAGLPMGTRLCTVGNTTAAGAVHATPTLIAVAGDSWTDCLVRIQQGEADGAVGDDAIMAGLQTQDRLVQVVGPRLSEEPYGLAIAKSNPDLVRFVNACLERIRHDGTWTKLYDTYLAHILPDTEAATAPEAVYQD